MIFLVSLCIALLFVILCSEVMIKNPVPFYVGATVIALVSIYVTWSGIEMPFLLKEYVMPIIGRGGLTGALFVIVMYAGYDLTVFVYIFIFVSYFVCRIVKALNMNNAERIPKRQVVAVACALFVATLVVSIITNSTVVSATANANTKKSNEKTSNESKAPLELNDGVYHGEGMGNNGSIEVDVTIEEGQITDIVFTKFVDDKEYFNEEIDGKTMINEVIREQSCDVDGISGATYSSKGFLNAVENALEKAKN